MVYINAWSHGSKQPKNWIYINSMKIFSTVTLWHVNHLWSEWSSRTAQNSNSFKFLHTLVTHVVDKPELELVIIGRWLSNQAYLIASDTCISTYEFFAWCWHNLVCKSILLESTTIDRLGLILRPFFFHIVQSRWAGRVVCE